MTPPDYTEKYTKQSLRYLSNAEKALESGDYDKAGEFFWGSATQALKALAAKNEIELKYHRDFWSFVQELSQEISEPELYDYFLTAHHLHSNFYEVELDANAVLNAARHVVHLVNRLLELVDGK